MFSAYTAFLKKLDENSVWYVLHSHKSVVTISDVEGMQAFPEDRLLKTLVFKIGDARWALAVLLGSQKLSYKGLADVLGIRRSDLVRATPSEVEGVLGAQVGGIAPYSEKNFVEVVFDSGVSSLGTVYCGVGRNDKTLEINASDLIYISNGRMGAISQ